MRRSLAGLAAISAVMSLGTPAPDVPLAAPSPRKRSWHHLIPADAKRNGRGDYISPRKRRRRRVESVIGPLSGRQWVRHRKALNKAGVA